MSRQFPATPKSETPIERIFERVMHRKMTEEEREVFHLSPGMKRGLEKSNGNSGLHHKNGNGLPRKNSAKLTSI